MVVDLCGCNDGARRIWSLWEVLTVNSKKFVRISQLVSKMHGSLDTMLRFGEKAKPNDSYNWDIADINEWREVSVELSAMGLEYSHKAAQRLFESFGKNASPNDVLRDLNDLETRISDELESQPLLRIDARKLGYFQKAELFGRSVFDAFPSANEDISEAGTCLALDRGTACVMHLSRALEVGLKALASSVGVGSQNDWGKYLSEIEKELIRRAKSAGARTPDEQFYAEAHVVFDSLRRAWRNPSMHVDKQYSIDRAEEILISVRSFMVHLATRIKE